MGCLNGKCDTCGQTLRHDEKQASDDICESCFFEQGIFDDEVSE